MDSLPTIGYEQIVKARKLLSKYLRPTRLQSAPSLSRATGATITLKMETELPTGTFKVRGALWALARKIEHKSIPHVVTASTGNHGAAVAYAAGLLKLHCTVFLPESPNVIKRKRISELGVTIVEKGRNLTEAAASAREYAESQGAYFLDDATDPDLPAGPATIACELIEQEPGVEMIVVPVGDTALIRGVAAAVHFLRPDVQVIGVQSTNVPGYHAAWHARQIVSAVSVATIADGLASQMPVPANVSEILNLVDDFVLVSEQEMLSAIKYLILEERVLSEPAGAAPAAALLNGKVNVTGKSVCALVSGANISQGILEASVRTQW